MPHFPVDAGLYQSALILTLRPHGVRRHAIQGFIAIGTGRAVDGVPSPAMTNGVASAGVCVTINAGSYHCTLAMGIPPSRAIALGAIRRAESRQTQIAKTTQMNFRPGHEWPVRPGDFAGEQIPDLFAVRA
jgi:hypothetical protein